MKFLFNALLLLPVAVFAEVYKTEVDGKVVYTTKPPTKGAKPAELPKLGRWEVTKVNPQQATCENHGGLDCNVGADGDGSVICLDGFKESAQRFAFSCTAAKLEIVEIGQVTTEGEVTVVVRNSKPVPANDTLVAYKAGKFEQEERFEGPSHIEAFSIAEFRLRPAKNFKAAPTLAQLTVRCANCG